MRCATAVSSRYVAAAQALRSVALNGQPSTCAFHPATHVPNPAHLRSALTTKSATSARVMLPQTVTSSAGEMQGKWFVGGKLGSQYQPNPTLKLTSQHAGACSRFRLQATWPHDNKRQLVPSLLRLVERVEW